MGCSPHRVTPHGTNCDWQVSSPCTRDETISLNAATKTTENYMKRNLITLLILALGVFAFSSCVPLAVGAAAGYVAHEEGYRVQSPVTHH